MYTAKILKEIANGIKGTYSCKKMPLEVKMYHLASLGYSQLIFRTKSDKKQKLLTNQLCKANYKVIPHKDKSLTISWE